MNVNSILQQLPFFADKSSMLVCETDGFHLNAAVVSRHHKQLKVDFFAQSDALNYQDAVKAVVTRLREKGWQGRDAVLLTPAVLSAVVELPIAPHQPRNPLQMQELIRWELEPLMIQHAANWSIGQLLLSKGYLTESQVADVLAQQKGKAKSGLGTGHGAMYSFKRFAEFAIDLGYVNQAQVDECLARQAWLSAEGDDVLCGWAMPSVSQKNTSQKAGASQPADGSHSSWLVSGANAALVRQWESAFLSHKITLSDVFPLVGCASVLAPAKDAILLLESAHGFVGALRQQEGEVKAIDMHKRPAMSVLDACLESYHQMVTPESNQLWFCLSPDDSLVAKQLGDMIGREIHTISPISASLSAGTQGVASHLLTHHRGTQVASVSVRGPKPSLFKRVEVRAIAAGLALLLLIGALEASLFVRHQLVQNAHTKTAESKKQFDAIVATAQAKVDVVNKLNDDIKTKNATLTNLNERFDFFASELASRTTFVQKLLENLNNAVTEDVVVNSIDETPKLGIRFSAWALSEKSAQQFIQSYKNAMAPLGMELHDPIVRSQTGRLGLYGYDISFRLLNPNEIVANTKPVAAATLPAGKPAKK
ncbi:MAG: hypothetical protein V4545_07675 [Pseudomonadota bacterium]